MRARLSVAAVLAAVTMVPTSAAQTSASSLVVVGSSERVVTLRPAEKGGGLVGRLTLLVRNESDRVVRLRARFFVAGEKQPTPLSSVLAPEVPTDRAVLYTTRPKLATGRLQLRPRRTALLPLRFGVLEKRADLVTGTLVVFAQADPKVQSASVATTGELPAVVEAATPPAQPPKVTLRVQRLLPAGARDNWRIETQPLVWTPGTKLDALVLLSSGSGHSMKAGLSEPQGHQPIPEGMVEQKLVVKDLDAVGSYAGSLFVKSGTTDKIDVEAKVRDIILWPLIVVGIAALIGGFGVTRAQRWRSRQILRAELGRVRRDYETRKDAAQIGPPLGDDAEQTLTALEQAVSNAKSEEELDAVTERIRAARKAIDAWIVLDQAARALRTLQDKAPDVREVAQDTQEALDAAEWIPDDEAEAAKRLTQLRRQAAIVRAFHAAYDRWPPAAIKAYGEAKGAFATDLETGRLIGRLERVVKESQAIRELPEAAQEARVAEFAAELDQVVEADFGQIAMHGADWRRGVTEIRLTPEQLERSVRRWDWVLGSITFAVTVFLFVLGIYDDDFGTWDDYAKAFAAGFLGQVGGAAVWNLLPPLRSYGIPVPKPAK